MPVLRPLRGPLSLLTLAAFAACGLTPATAPPDLVVFGRVWTGDSARPWAGAVAVGPSTVSGWRPREV